MARKTQKSSSNNKRELIPLETATAVIARETKEDRDSIIQKGGEENMAATITRTEEELRDIQFVFQGDGAKSVKLAGAFTDWEKGAVEMVKAKDGKWSIILKLAPGEYQYKFLVDGEWALDPAAKADAWNDLGSTNSWISVE
jgi:1,4-alpha-glucan branching enzyme